MSNHKYHVGQVVHFSRRRMDREAPHGDFRVERLLPAEGGDVQYRVKAVEGGRERVVQEGQISDQLTLEMLAQSLYEAGNVNGVPWARRERTVREAWLEAARSQMEDGTEDKTWRNPR
jgi:hypothetical protein